MTDLLVKLFVKNRDDIDNQEVRTGYGVLSSVVGVICNIILFGIKIVIGTIINSISITADAFNNLSDAVSGVISFVGVKLASRPADKQHPFGHGRYEYIAALIVAFLVLQVGFSCFKSSITKIIHPEEVGFQLVLIIILIISVFLKIWLGFFNRKLGNRINSSVMKATAADAFSDVGITAATIISVIVGKLTGLKIDGYMGLIVSVMVLLAGFNIIKDTLAPLIGEAVDPELYKRITEKVESYEDIIGSHDLIVHSYGPSHTMATLHAEVPNDIELEHAHETIDKIERDVLREMNIFLVIHMDPVAVHDETLNRYRDMVLDVLKGLDSEATIHDFRMIKGEEQINLVFDLVVPHSCRKEEKIKLLSQLKSGVLERDRKCQCVITAEYSYIGEE